MTGAAYSFNQMVFGQCVSIFLLFARMICWTIHSLTDHSRIWNWSCSAWADSFKLIKFLSVSMMNFLHPINFLYGNRQKKVGFEFVSTTPVQIEHYHHYWFKLPMIFFLFNSYLNRSKLYRTNHLFYIWLLWKFVGDIVKMCLLKSWRRQLYINTHGKSVFFNGTISSYSLSLFRISMTQLISIYLLGRDQMILILLSGDVECFLKLFTWISEFGRKLMLSFLDQMALCLFLFFSKLLILSIWIDCICLYFAYFS